MATLIAFSSTQAFGVQVTNSFVMRWRFCLAPGRSFGIVGRGAVRQPGLLSVRRGIIPARGGEHAVPAQRTAAVDDARAAGTEWDEVAVMMLAHHPAEDAPE